MQYNNKNWLSIVGIGEEGVEGLTKAALNCLETAKFIFGGRRHLDFICDRFTAQQNLWVRPFSDNFNKILALKGQKTVILASGDPMFYGAGASFLRYFAPEEVTIYPHSSSFSLGAARLGWPLQDVCCCSAHGRNLYTILRFIENGARLLILANDGSTARLLSCLLQQRGFTHSKITVMEHLGGSQEKLFSGKVCDFTEKIFAELNLIALDCVSDSDSVNFPRCSILPDSAFTHDGQLTKQEIRALTFVHLAPQYGELLWDIGAGCGSISIEWLRSGYNVSAIAVEQNPERCSYIRQNAEYFGVPDLQIHEGTAPRAILDLNPPDAIFIGGGITTAGMLETCWDSLKPKGRLIAHAVTLESQAHMVEWAKSQDSVQFIKFSLSHAEPLGRFHVWRKALPVVMLIAKKK